MSNTIDKLTMTFIGDDDEIDEEIAFRTMSGLEEIVDDEELDTGVNKLTEEAKAYIEEARRSRKTIRQATEDMKSDCAPANGETESDEGGRIRRYMRRIFGRKKK